MMGGVEPLDMLRLMFLVNSDVLTVLAASLNVIAGPPGLIAH
jgi:hypothetical protein